MSLFWLMQKLWRWLKSISIANLLWYLLIIWVLYSRYPTWREASSLEGKVIGSMQLHTLTGQSLQWPAQMQTPAVLVFWASWCGPCKIELNRFNQAIIDKEIPAANFYAINVGEDATTVQQAVKEHGYLFQVLLDQTTEASQFYKVSATPTVVHIDAEQKIAWVATGISPTGIYRAKKLFSDQQANSVSQSK